MILTKEILTGKTRVDAVEQLLKEADKALEDINKKMSEGAGFNVFRLCGVNHYETSYSEWAGSSVDSRSNPISEARV